MLTQSHPRTAIGLLMGHKGHWASVLLQHVKTAIGLLLRQMCLCSQRGLSD